jgi:hypothetical protein
MKLDSVSEYKTDTWVTDQGCHCCMIHTVAYPPDKTEDGGIEWPGEVFVSVLSIGANGSYWRSWRGRLACIWKIIKGDFVMDSFNFYNKPELDAFIKDLEGAREVAYPPVAIREVVGKDNVNMSDGINTKVNNQ